MAAAGCYFDIVADIVGFHGFVVMELFAWCEHFDYHPMMYLHTAAGLTASALSALAVAVEILKLLLK